MASPPDFDIIGHVVLRVNTLCKENKVTCLAEARPEGLLFTLHKITGLYTAKHKVAITWLDLQKQENPVHNVACRVAVAIADIKRLIEGHRLEEES